MRSSLRSAAALVRLGTLALAVCLLAPPLGHNHGSHHVPVATIDGQPCSGGEATAHLHAASIEPAPACPACAAGPTWAGVPAHTGSVRPPVFAEPITLRLAARVGTDHRPTRRSRAPPAIPTV